MKLTTTTPRDDDMTAAMTSLIVDSRAAGYDVTTDAVGTTLIVRRVGRWKKAEGLVIYADGTAFLADMDLSAARGVRSYKQMRSLLGI